MNKYILSDDDASKLSNRLRGTSTYFVVNGINYMDSSIVAKMKLRNSMDVIINSTFTESSFDEFLLNRVKPYFKLYDFLDGKSIKDRYAAPVDYDFKTDLKISLKKKNLPKSKGKPTSVEYYEKKYIKIDANGVVIDTTTGQPVIVYENLICKIDFTLLYDTIGFIYQKIAKLSWAMSDGSISAEFKDIGEVYDGVLDHEKRIKEGKQRRGAIVDGLQLPAMGMLFKIFPTKTTIEILSIGRDFLNSHDEVFRDYVDKSLSVTDVNSADYGKKVAVVAIENDLTTWLDSVTDIGFGPITPRAFIVYQLTI